MRKCKHGKKFSIYYEQNFPITLQRKVNVKKDVFPSCHERGIKKNSEFPHEEDSSWRPKIFLYPTLVTRRKNIFLNYSSSVKLIISTISIRGKCHLFNILVLND